MREENDFRMSCESSCYSHSHSKFDSLTNTRGNIERCFSLDVIDQADLFEDLFHEQARSFPIFQHKFLRPNKDHLAHREVPHALQGIQVGRFIAEAVADGCRHQFTIRQRMVGQGKIQVVAHGR